LAEKIGEAPPVGGPREADQPRAGVFSCFYFSVTFIIPVNVPLLG